MSFFEAILMGIVQGVTEFLPVSSSGHLAILRHILGITQEQNVLFNILLHLGSLIAVFFAFKQDIKHILIEFSRIVLDIISNIKLWFYNIKTKEGKRYTKILHNNYRKLVALILFSTIPSCIFGYLLQDLARSAATSLIGSGIGLLITGVVLLVVDFVPRGKKIPKDADFKAALLIGVCQGFSVFTGLSRTGVTLSGALFCGFNRKFAIKYTFLMAIPGIIGATIFDLFHFTTSNITFLIVVSYILAAVIAGMVGYFCIKTMVKFIERRRLRRFAYYCFFIGTIAIIINFVR